ncbi:MAG: hypothetical protein LLG05_14045 [Porphyromonadaceae bacterium]|nr:hypothetical protein [Porphyromonadaceae bacterium]
MISKRLNDIGIKNVKEFKNSISFSTDNNDQYEKAIMILKEDGWRNIKTEALVIDADPKIIFQNSQSFYAEKPTRG